MDVSGSMIDFDYGLISHSGFAVAGTNQTNSSIITPVMISTAGEHTCTVTITAPGVCGGGGSEPACPNKTSDPVTLGVQCECSCVNIVDLKNEVYHS